MWSDWLAAQQAVQLGLEESAAFTALASANLGPGGVVTLDLHLVSDPASARIEAYYEVNQSGAVIRLGEVSVPPTWFTDNQGAAGTSLAGIMTSHGSAEPTIVWYDHFRISEDPNLGPLLEKAGLVSVEAETLRRSNRPGREELDRAEGP